MQNLRNRLVRAADEAPARCPTCPLAPRIGGARTAAEGGAPNDRGSVTVEYAVLLGVVSLGCVFAVMGLGIPLVRMYQESQIWLLLPVP